MAGTGGDPADSPKAIVCCSTVSSLWLSEETVLQDFITFWIFFFFGVPTAVISGFPFPFDFWLLGLHSCPRQWSFSIDSLELSPSVPFGGGLERELRGWLPPLVGIGQMGAI